MPELLSKISLGTEFTPKLGMAVFHIAAENNLDIDPMLSLSVALNDVFDGKLPPKKLGEELQARCNLDEKKAFQVLSSTKEIFLDEYRAFLNELYKDSGGYFKDASDQGPTKPSDTTPKLDGNIVNLRNN